jgi:hypothetical protein
MAQLKAKLSLAAAEVGTYTSSHAPLYSRQTHLARPVTAWTSAQRIRKVYEAVGVPNIDSHCDGASLRDLLRARDLVGMRHLITAHDSGAASPREALLYGPPEIHHDAPLQI